MLIPLSKYLSNKHRDKDNEIINLIKCQALNIYSSECETTDIRHLVDLDHRSWFVDTNDGTLYCPAIHKSAGQSIDKYWHRWSNNISSLKLDTVLPEKHSIDGKLQREIHLRALEYIFENISCLEFVQDIYVLGTFAKNNLQAYSVPYVNRNWVYLYSPINIFLSIDETNLTTLPDDWVYMYTGKKSSTKIVALHQIKQNNSYSLQFPNIKFFHFLLRGHLYYPSSGKEQLRDTFLRRHSARLIYTKQLNLKPEYTERTLDKLASNEYGLETLNIVPLDEHSRNTLYKAKAGSDTVVIKIYTMARKSSTHKKLAKHLAYEADLIDELKKRDFPTAALIRTLDGSSVTNVFGATTAIFEYIDGKIFPFPDIKINVNAELLARYHQVQKNPLTVGRDIRFDAEESKHLRSYMTYSQSPINDEYRRMFSKLSHVFESYDRIKHEIYDNPDLAWCHCHGDFRPRNVIIRNSDAYLIDFELAHYGPRLVEICDGGFNHSINIRTGEFSIENFNEFINTYHRIYPLTEEERNLLHKTITYIGLLRFAKGCRGYDVSGRKSKIQTARALYSLLSQPDNYLKIRIRS